MSDLNNKHSDKRIDPVVDAYRQANAKESAGPKASVRAAVLAHARVVAAANATSAQSALYQAPKAAAANDHSWMWRAAAGLVLGVLGVLMFQWMRPTDHAEATVASASAPVSAPAAPAAPSVAAAPAPAAAPATDLAKTAVAENKADTEAPEKLALAQPHPARASVRTKDVARTDERPLDAETSVAAVTVEPRQSPPAAPSGATGALGAAGAKPSPPILVTEATPRAAPASPPPPAAASPAPAVASVAAAPAPAAAAGVAPRAEIAMRDEVSVAMAKRASAANSAAKESRMYADASVAESRVDKGEYARARGATASVEVGASADTFRANANAEVAARAPKPAAVPMPAKPYATLDDDLFEAIRKNNAMQLRSAIARGANVNAKTPLGRSALQMAREDNRDDLIEILIAAGAK